MSKGMSRMGSIAFNVGGCACSGRGGAFRICVGSIPMFMGKTG